MPDQKNLILGVCGSIAACRTPELIRLLQDEGWNVDVIMTRAATQFVTELTLRTISRNPVYLDLFTDDPGWRPRHIDLAEKADLLLIAPCTANTMAKLAHGIADDALSCTALANRAPLVIAPAMNERMWTHPATCENIDILSERGAVFVPMKDGELACGTEGTGKLADPEDIVSIVMDATDI
jgi:phosphopantothenoylcysteine synthetase/decarboxylase